MSSKYSTSSASKLEPQPACERLKCSVRPRLEDSSYPRPPRRSNEVFHPELRLTAATGFAVDPGGESSVVGLSFHLRSSVDALRMKAMQMNLSALVKQPNRSFASILLAFSLFRILHPHHT